MRFKDVLPHKAGDADTLGNIIHVNLSQYVTFMWRRKLLICKARGRFTKWHAFQTGRSSKEFLSGFDGSHGMEKWNPGQHLRLTRDSILHNNLTDLNSIICFKVTFSSKLLVLLSKYSSFYPLLSKNIILCQSNPRDHYWWWQFSSCSARSIEAWRLFEKVAVIGADSGRMTVRWVPFPLQKEIWCCERLAA